MKRLKQTFDKLKKENKKGFGVFLMSGYPDKKTFIELLAASAKAGASFIEVGMPFSDPSADGPVIKTAGTLALKNGTTIKETLDSIKQFRKINDTVPIVWMGYFNSMYNYGIEKFMTDIKASGVDGLLPVDLPIEECNRIKCAKNIGIDIIQLVTPVTSKERLPLILNLADGFIYFVSINGITGTKEADKDKIKQKVETIKTMTDLPVYVGFGIKTPAKAKEINEFANGSIVGTALLNKVANYLDINGKVTDKAAMIKEIENFVSDFTK